VVIGFYEFDDKLIEGIFTSTEHKNQFLV